MKTKTKPGLGPTTDSAFFQELAEVFARYPEEARRYAIRTLTLENDVLHIDFTKQHAKSQVDGDRIITTFHDRPAGQEDIGLVSSHHACCEWIGEGHDWHCIQQCLE